MASEFSETGKSKTADELGYHLGVLDSSKNLRLIMMMINKV